MLVTIMDFQDSLLSQTATCVTVKGVTQSAQLHSTNVCSFCRMAGCSLKPSTTLCCSDVTIGTRATQQSASCQPNQPCKAVQQLDGLPPPKLLQLTLQQPKFRARLWVLAAMGVGTETAAAAAHGCHGLAVSSATLQVRMFPLCKRP